MPPEWSFLRFVIRTIYCAGRRHLWGDRAALSDHYEVWTNSSPTIEFGGMLATVDLVLGTSVGNSFVRKTNVARDCTINTRLSHLISAEPPTEA